MTEAPMASGDSGTLDALRRVKAAESEWDEKIRSARTESESALVQAKASADAAVKAVAGELEASRTRALEAAGAAADLEARQILADGEKAAKQSAAGGSKTLAARKQQVLAAVLGDFGSE